MADSTGKFDPYSPFAGSLLQVAAQILSLPGAPETKAPYKSLSDSLAETTVSQKAEAVHYLAMEILKRWESIDWDE